MNIFRLILWPFRRRASESAAANAAPLTLEQYEKLEPNMVVREGAIDVVFSTPNAYTKFRVDTLRSKEPDTIAWIAGFQSDEVLVDIGANVGMYTIWAAKTRGMRVYAFEPESQNYALLYKNIVLNGMSDQVVAYCLALSDESSFSRLYLSEFLAGGSCHTFGEKLDHRLEHRPSKYSQGCISATLDHLVATGVVPMPNHIKVDVDGLEHKVINGCRNVLSDPRLKSVLVEINTNLELHRNIIRDMEALGFRYSASQVAMALRTEGAFAGVGNHIFQR
jgi:FkbM family methyltransferase